MIRTVWHMFLCLITLLAFTGCSLKYAVDDPPAPGFTYQNVDPKPLVIRVVDQRDTVKFMVGISGLQRIDLGLDNVDDPVVWLAKGVVNELKARGIPLQLVAQDSTTPADLTLTVKKFQLINHRASGFSAWESYNIFLGQVSAGSKSCTIPTFVFNSKVPVWSMDEIRKPCVSDPMGTVVKEVAAKINQCAFNYVASDADVQHLVAVATSAVSEDIKSACFPLSNLGSTNNQTAMPALKKFAEHDESIVHNCAVGAIGILGAGGEFEFLEGRFSKFSANDRVMPLKAIGDIGSSRAQDFLRQVQRSGLYNEENGVRYCTDLYLTR